MENFCSQRGNELDYTYSFIFPRNFRGIILLIRIILEFVLFVRLLSRNIGGELKKKRRKKRWRSDFVLISVGGKRRLWWWKARIGRGRIWQFCKKSNEKELKSRGARRGEKGSFNGFRKKETAGRSSGREKGENKI